MESAKAPLKPSLPQETGNAAAATRLSTKARARVPRECLIPFIG